MKYEIIKPIGSIKTQHVQSSERHKKDFIELLEKLPGIKRMYEKAIKKHMSYIDMIANNMQQGLCFMMEMNFKIDGGIMIDIMEFCFHDAWVYAPPSAIDRIFYNGSDEKDKKMMQALKARVELCDYLMEAKVEDIEWI